MSNSSTGTMSEHPISDKFLEKARENQFFGNVLAVIHRDGGHYITEHGAEKASRDAIKIIIDERAARETALMRNIDLKRTVEWMLIDLDYRNRNLGIEKEDSPEVAFARELIK